MRAFQFPSIVLDGCEGIDRNIWIIDNRFAPGRPRAKQRGIQFSDTLFWFPRQSTSALATLFFFQQPFICSLLQRMGSGEHLYASHVWPLWPIPNTDTIRDGPTMLWQGPDVSQYVVKHSEEISGTRLDPAIIRQMVQGVLRDKVPSLFMSFLSRDSEQLADGSYRFLETLRAYANQHGLQALQNATGIPVETAAECLIVVDIWQCMHGIEPPNVVWKSMVANSHLFPATEHDDLAYLEARNSKQVASLTTGLVISEDSLTRCLKLLEIEDHEVPESNVRIRSAVALWADLISTPLSRSFQE
jgi:hypothetical protein